MTGRRQAEADPLGTWARSSSTRHGGFGMVLARLTCVKRSRVVHLVTHDDIGQSSTASDTPTTPCPLTA
jgi:hypothetical protein